MIDVPPAEFEHDRQEAARLLAGDEKLFRELVDAWSPSMLRLAHNFVDTKESAEDVVQEAWLSVLRGLHSFEGRSKFRTWVFQILVNIARRRGQRDWRTLPFSDLSTHPTVPADRFQGLDGQFPGGWRQFPVEWPSGLESDGPESSVLRAEVREVIERAMLRLPDHQRAVLQLRDVMGFRADEVSQLLGVTAVNQRTLLHRARASVRHEVAQYLGYPI